MFLGKRVRTYAPVSGPSDVFAKVSGYGSRFWVGFGMFLRTLGLSGRSRKVIGRRWALYGWLRVLDGLFSAGLLEGGNAAIHSCIFPCSPSPLCCSPAGLCLAMRNDAEGRGRSRYIGAFAVRLEPAKLPTLKKSKFPPSVLMPSITISQNMRICQP